MSARPPYCFSTSSQFPVSRIGHEEPRRYTLVGRVWWYLSGNCPLLEIWAANLDQTECSVIHQNEYGRCGDEDSYDRAKFARSFSVVAIFVHRVFSKQDFIWHYGGRYKYKSTMFISKFDCKPVSKRSVSFHWRGDSIHLKQSIFTVEHLSNKITKKQLICCREVCVFY